MDVIAPVSWSGRMTNLNGIGIRSSNIVLLHSLTIMFNTGFPITKPILSTVEQMSSSTLIRSQILSLYFFGMLTFRIGCMELEQHYFSPKMAQFLPDPSGTQNFSTYLIIALAVNLLMPVELHFTLVLEFKNLSFRLQVDGFLLPGRYIFVKTPLSELSNNWPIYDFNISCNIYIFPLFTPLLSSLSPPPSPTLIIEYN